MKFLVAVYIFAISQSLAVQLGSEMIPPGIPGMGAPPPVDCAQKPKEWDKINATVHMVDARRTEIVSHSNQRDGDHVKVKKTKRKEAAAPGGMSKSDAALGQAAMALGFGKKFKSPF